ncbi:hypothetical protein GBA52_024763 [Prunus armeniaca]|nr:hypothetical protein GBA52_024763 [Prunus armeniaca]
MPPKTVKQGLYSHSLNFRRRFQWIIVINIKLHQAQLILARAGESRKMVHLSRNLALEHQNPDRPHNTPMLPKTIKEGLHSHSLNFCGRLQRIIVIIIKLHQAQLILARAAECRKMVHLGRNYALEH